MFFSLIFHILSFLEPSSTGVQINSGGCLLDTKVTKFKELRISKIYNLKKAQFTLEETQTLLKGERYTIKSIDSYAFSDTRIKSIVIKCQLADICPYAFAECMYLKHLDLELTSLTVIPDNCFYNSSKLTDIKLPKIVKSIGESAFAFTGIEKFSSWNDLSELGENCFGDSKLTFANLQDGNIKQIPSHLFSGCKYLSSIVLSSKLSSIGSFAFAGTNMSTIPLDSSIKTLGKSAFSYMPVLTSLSFEKTLVTEIPDFCFEFSHLLTNVELSSRITSIGVGSFSGTGIKSFVVPQTIKQIDSGAFRNCTKLTSIDLRSLSIQELPTAMFCGCSALTKIAIPKTLINFLEWSYSGTAIKKIIFSINAVSIGQHCFEGCQNLEEVSMINSKITHIPNYAFKGCYKLSTIRLPTSLTGIGESAFENTAIGEYSATSLINQLGPKAFANNTNLTTVNFSQLSITSIPAELFKGCTSLSLFIPSQKFISFGVGVFENCGFVNLSIPNNFQALNIKLYAGCESLERVDLSRVSFRSIPPHCFEGCTSLMRVVLPKIKSSPGLLQEKFTFREYSFKKCGFLKLHINFTSFQYKHGIYTECLSLVNVTLSGSPNFRIPAEFFKGCVNLQSINCPQFAHEFGRECFAGCGITNLSVSFSDVYKEDGVHMFSPKLEEVSYSFLAVVKIPARTFYGCYNLKKVNIEPNELYIGDYALACTGVTYFRTVGLWKEIGVGVFENSSLQTFVFDRWIRGPIPPRFFYGCENLRYVEVYKRKEAIAINITGYDEYSMAYTTSMPNLPQLNFVTVIGSHAFEGSGIYSGTWNAHLQVMYNSAFAHCHNLVELSLLGTSLKIIPNYAFYDTPKLKSFLFPQFVSNSIMSYAFEKCGLNDLHIPSSVVYISGYAFVDSALRSIDLSNLPMRTLGAGMFANCSNLKSVILPKHLKVIGHSCFANSSIEEFGPDFDLEYIGYKAFEGCKNLVLVNLERTIISNLSRSLCEGCTALKSVYLPLTVRVIRKRCFANTNLQALIAPGSLDVIAESAFEGCGQLTMVDLCYVSVIGPCAFRGAGLKHLIMPNVPYVIKEMAFAESKLEKVDLNNCTEMANDAFADSLVKYFNATDSTFESFDFDQAGLLSLEWISLPKTIKKVDGTIVGEAYYCGNTTVKGTANGYIHLKSGFKGRFGEANADRSPVCPAPYEAKYIGASSSDPGWNDVAVEDPRFEGK